MLFVPFCGAHYNPSHVIRENNTFFRLCSTRLRFAAVGQPDRIVAAVEAEDWQTARAEINKVRSANEALFRDKNYDYLLGRIAERTGDIAGATRKLPGNRHRTIRSSRNMRCGDWQRSRAQPATSCSSANVCNNSLPLLARVCYLKLRPCD